MAVVGGARQGQSRRGHFGLVAWTWLPEPLKHRPSDPWSAPSTSRLARTTDGVLRALARIQRFTTLTGESPTLFQTPGWIIPGWITPCPYVPDEPARTTQRRDRRPCAS